MSFLNDLFEFNSFVKISCLACKKYLRKYNHRLMEVCAYFCMFFPCLFLYALFTPDQGIVCLWWASAVWSSFCQRLLCESETDYIFAYFVDKSTRMTIERNMIKKKNKVIWWWPRFRDWLDTWDSVSAEPSETGASFELSSKMTIRKMVANGKVRLINNCGIKVCFLLPSSICIDLSWPTPIMVKTTM